MLLKHFIEELKTYYHDYYAGKIQLPCDETCDEDCSEKHMSELPEEYPPLFNLNRKD